MDLSPVPYVVRGETYVGCLATPSGPGPHAAVLQGPEGTGIGPQAKERLRELAALGYVAFCADFVGNGAVLPDMPSMMARLGVLRSDPSLVRELGRAALAELVKRPDVDPSRVAAIGYCFGGTFALELARDGAPLACTVAFHAGLGTADPSHAKNIRGKVLVCSGADDPLVPPEMRTAFENEMRSAGLDWRLEVYGNAKHGFANPNADKLGNPAVGYHEPSHRRSWRSMLALFDEALVAR